MQTFLIVIHLMLVLAMVGVVLLQKSEGGGLGIGSTGGFLTSRGTANVLTRTTALLAAGFFATSLVLSIIAGVNRHPTTIIQPASSGAPPAPGQTGTPPAPAGNNGGLLDTLRQQEKGSPQVPQSQ
jgi:preprotein translocase subunit SecG